jgi:hypothetical protein
MHPVSLPEMERLAADHGLAIVRAHDRADQQGRAEISWTCVTLRLPDDGTGALPLLRHVILRNEQGVDLQLGLLRGLCRFADGCRVRRLSGPRHIRCGCNAEFD